MSTNDYLPTIDRDAQRYELWNRIAVWCKCPRWDGVEVAADAIDEELDTMLQAYAREAVAADRAKRAVPDGWQLVPKIPTLGMCQHGIRKAREFPKVPLRLTPIYAAMLAAAPLPKEQT